MPSIYEAQLFSQETDAGETETIIRKLRWMTYARLAVFVFLGGATAVFGVETIHPNEARFVVGHFRPVDATDLVLFFTAGAGCTLTLLYAFALRFVRSLKNLKRLAHFQIMADAVFAAIMVLLTGGTTSSFAFFFSIVIIEGAIITYRTGAFYTATFCTLLFIGIGVAEVTAAEGQNVLTEAVAQSDVRPANQIDAAAAWGGLAYRILNSIVAFYSIAFMSSYLSERLRRSAQQLELNRLSLEDLRAIHENIVASIPVGVITLDPKGRISFINPQAQMITGLVPGAALNKPVSEFLPRLKPLIEGPEGAEPTLLTVQTGGGIVRDQLWSMAPLKNRKGRVIGHLLAVEDVTNTREMEKQVQRSERYATLGRLAATIAHEIRNPLTSIAGSIQLFGQGEDRSDEDKRLMAIVVRETEALNRWITDFLTYARPLGQERGTLDIGREVGEALEALRNDQRAAKLDIQSAIPDNAIALSDPVAVKQIVWNILINAVEAMPDGGKLWVEVDALTVEGFIQLRITDTGHRIDAENAERIFDPFFTTKAGGTGLGLATAFRLAAELDGKLDFNTLFGEGTTFYLDLPKPDEGAQTALEAVAGLQLSEADRQLVKTERASRLTDEHAALLRDQDPAPPGATTQGSGT